MTLQVSLWPGDDAVHVSPAPEAKKPRLGDTTLLVAALRSHLPDVRACFVEGRKRHPGLWGRIGMRLRMSAPRARSSMPPRSSQNSPIPMSLFACSSPSPTATFQHLEKS